MDERITVSSADGPFSGHVARPPVPAAPGVVVAHDIFGIDLDIREACAALAGLGYVVVCPDLFWRRDASTEWHGSMRPLANLAAFDLDKGTADLDATLAAVRALDGVNGRVGLVGFGLGGLLAFLAASRRTIDVAVAYEAAGIEHHLDHAGSLPTPLLLHLAGDDEFAPWPVQQEIIAALDPVAHVEIEVHAGSRHGFTRRSGPSFDAAASAKAFASTAEFLRAHLVG